MNYWLNHHARDWLKLADFESACRFFDDVRTATHFRVRMPDNKQFFVTRAALDELAKRPDIDRIAYCPAPQPE